MFLGRIICRSYFLFAGLELHFAVGVGLYHAGIYGSILLVYRFLLRVRTALGVCACAKMVLNIAPVDNGSDPRRSRHVACCTVADRVWGLQRRACPWQRQHAQAEPTAAAAAGRGALLPQAVPGARKGQVRRSLTPPRQQGCSAGSSVPATIDHFF